MLHCKKCLKFKNTQYIKTFNSVRQRQINKNINSFFVKGLDGTVVVMVDVSINGIALNSSPGLATMCNGCGAFPPRSQCAITAPRTQMAARHICHAILAPRAAMAAADFRCAHNQPSCSAERNGGGALPLFHIRSFLVHGKRWEGNAFLPCSQYAIAAPRTAVVGGAFLSC